MCFVPQRRALFRHRNFQKWSEHGVFCTFWLRNALRATTACNFSSLIWPAGSAPTALARLLLDPPEPQIIGKTQWIATSLPFRAPASSFFWLSPSLIFSLLDFSSLTLPTSAFPSLHIVGSLTSKLRSMIYTYNIGIFLIVKHQSIIHQEKAFHSHWSLVNWRFHSAEGIFCPKFRDMTTGRYRCLGWGFPESWGYCSIAGRFISWKIPSINGWWLGVSPVQETPI